MTTMRDRLRFLLVQIRNPEDPMGAHEHECFVNAAGVAPEQIVTIDAITASFEDVRLDEFDALLVGGSGEYSMARPKAPFFEPLKAFLGDLIDRDYPIFASCFGFHVITVVLGGTVVTDRETMEVGTFELQLTPAGRQDLLFDGLGDRFLAQMGHKDRLEKIPDGVEVLARGEVIACQAFRLPGKRIWATQFHPELTSEGNRHRYLHYFSVYPGKEPDNAILDSFRKSPESNALVGRFIEKVLTPP